MTVKSFSGYMVACCCTLTGSGLQTTCSCTKVISSSNMSCADLALGTMQAETSELSSDRFDDTVHQFSGMRIQDDVTVCLPLPGLPWCVKRCQSEQSQHPLCMSQQMDCFHVLTCVSCQWHGSDGTLFKVLMHCSLHETQGCVNMLPQSIA